MNNHDTNGQYLRNLCKIRRLTLVRGMNEDLALDCATIATILLPTQIRFMNESRNVIQYGSKFIPVFNMRSSHEPSVRYADENIRMIIAAVRSQKIGILVDQVTGTLEATPLDIHALPFTYGDIHYAIGTVALPNKKALVIDMARLLFPYNYEGPNALPAKSDQLDYQQLSS
jgi:chemotaxis signal transduction protein